MNSRQIQSHIDEILHHPDEPSLLQPLVDYSRICSPSACRDIIDQIKRIFKRNRWDPTEKLQALRLFDQCMRQNNQQFIEYAGRKILRRLTVLAAHRKVRDT